MKQIDKMSDVEILTYVRDERDWLIESFITKEDLEKRCDTKFSKFTWPVMRSFLCTVFDIEVINTAKKFVKEEKESWSKISGNKVFFKRKKDN